MLQKHQVNALLRKSVVYQKKNWVQNCCVLVVPAVILIAIAVGQTVVDREIEKILNEQVDVCGCICLKCELPGDGVNTTNRAACNPTVNAPECLDFDEATCGVAAPFLAELQINDDYITAYDSNGDEVDLAECSITMPAVVQPMFDVPAFIDADGDLAYADSAYDYPGDGPASASDYDYGEEALTPSAAPAPTPAGVADQGTLPLRTARSLWTSDEDGDAAFAAALMNGLLRTPDIAAGVAQPEVAAAIQARRGADARHSLDFRFLAAVPLDIATASFFDSDLASGMAVTGNCTALRASFEAAIAEAGTQPDALFGPDVILQACLEIAFERLPTAAAINERALCAAGSPYDYSSDATDDSPECLNSANMAQDTEALTDLFDWHDSAPGALRVDIWHRPQFVEVEEEDYYADIFGSVSPRRLHKPVSRAAGSFVEQWLGPGYSSELQGITGMPQVATNLDIDIAAFLGAFVFLFMLQITFPLCLSLLVYEKQARLRLMMRMHGLSTSAYVFITYLYFMALYTGFIVVMLVVGAAADIGFFVDNGWGVQIIFYLLFGNVQIALCFVLAPFFTKARTATILGFVWVIVTTLFAQLLLDSVIISNRWWIWLVQLIPTFGAYRGLWELAALSNFVTRYGGSGLTLSNANENGAGMGTVLLIFALELPLFMLAAWYLDQVVGSGTGASRPWLFPCQSCLAKRSQKYEPAAGGSAGADAVVDVLPEWQDNKTAADAAAGAAPSHARADDAELHRLAAEDVERERQAAESAEPGEACPIVLRGISKTFPKMDGNPEKVAVRSLSLAVPAGECFGLLGPNGAGKSTAINMMIGFLRTDHGAAFIAGSDLAVDSDSVYARTGVCPQDNYLWETLTPREHLNFYGRLKKLSGAALKQAVDAVLSQVQLLDVANKRTAKFSGGMKRRLSVAISLIGSPKVAYLDEPSSGLDPAARRRLWSVIQGAKAGKAIILTTHSMEEAEVLCDRIGIFVDGSLVCLGNPKQLTSRYGGYYVLTLTVPDGNQAAAEAFAKSLARGVNRTYAVAGTLKFSVPCGAIELSDVFEKVAAAQEEGLQIEDWGIHNASLEDVFISLATRS